MGTGLLVAAGVVGWFIAAMFIRMAIPLGWFEGTACIVTFVAALPASWVLVALVRWAINGVRLVERVTLLCVVALLLDGVALVWFPALYGASGAALLPPAAWLLFGVGAIEGAALTMARR